MGYIYGLYCTCHPERGVRYIGQTTGTIEHRLYIHKQNTRTDTKKYAVNLWIRKHSEENIHTRLLETVTDLAALDGAEMDWIANLRAAGFKLLNLTVGGRGTRGVVRSQETRRRMSESRIGKRVGVDNHNFGKPMSEETKEKMRQSKLGYKWSEESRANRTILKGEMIGTSKLTAEMVLDIRSRVDSGESAASAGRAYGIGRSHAARVVKRETWAHID